MKISLGCDEAAYQLKETIKQHLQEAGHEVIDNGVGEGEVELYPDVAVRTCKKVTDGTCDRGILVCGTGIGMAMTANKVPGIRAAVCHDPFSTERSILSNDANVMCMGARVIAPQLALYLLDIWMGLTFKNGPSTPKVERIMEYQKEFCGKEEGVVMKFKFGVDSFIWAEDFKEKDLWIIEKAKEIGFEVVDFAIANPYTFPTEQVKAELARVGMDCVCTTTLTLETNPISPDKEIRKAAVAAMKKCVDICNTLGAPILGGVNYAGWGYLTKKPRTDQEWDWGVACMREVAEYAKETGDVTICVECVNRFETHFLNIAEDAVKFCKDVGTGNVKVHLDCFHMIREEKSFSGAVKTCGKEYLGYVHVNENDRGIPGTGLVPFKEFFQALDEIGYDGPLVIESFDPSFEELAGNCAIWRNFADTGEELAIEGLKNLKAIADAM